MNSAPHWFVLLVVEVLTESYVHYLPLLTLRNCNLLNISVWEWVQLTLHRMKDISSRVHHVSSIAGITIWLPVLHWEFKLFCNIGLNIKEIEHEGRIGLSHTFISQYKSIAFDFVISITINLAFGDDFSFWNICIGIEIISIQFEKNDIVCM